MGNSKHETPPMFLSDQQWKLLALAESILYGDECENHCAYFDEGIYPCECPHFVCGEGYLVCNGYKQKGGEDG